MMGEMAQHYADTPAVDLAWKTDELYSVQHTQDKQWYRSKIKHFLLNNRAQVSRFIYMYTVYTRI